MKENTVENSGLDILFKALFISICIPIIFYLGPVKLFFYKIILLISLLVIVPRFMNLKKSALDYIVLIVCIWSTIAYVAVEGARALEGVGNLWIDMFFPYMMARVVIRGADDFYRFHSFVFKVIVCLIPFFLYEVLTGTPPILEILSKFSATIPNVPHELRLGLDRAQGPFDHPILLGVICYSFLSASILVLGYGKSNGVKFARSSVVFFAGFTSLSSGPLAGAAAQFGLMMWNYFLRKIKKRFLLLSLAIAGFYILVDLVSNSTPLKVAFRYLAFNANTAWSRINIWQYGSENMFAHPVFGLGDGDWVRLPWMPASVDMFWLLLGMRHGLVVFFGAMLMVIYPVVASIRLELTDDRVSSYRYAYAFGLVSFFVAGWSVHFWNATLITFMFAVGSGVWVLDPRYRTSAAGSFSEDEPGARDLDGSKPVGAAGYNRDVADAGKGAEKSLPYTRKTALSYTRKKQPNTDKRRR